MVRHIARCPPPPPKKTLPFKQSNIHVWNNVTSVLFFYPSILSFLCKPKAGQFPASWLGEKDGGGINVSVNDPLHAMHVHKSLSDLTKRTKQERR